MLIPGAGFAPNVLETLTMLPRLASKWGSTAWTSNVGPRTLVAHIWCAAAGSICPSGAGVPMPALLTSRSIRPSSAAAAVTISARPAGSDTSPTRTRIPGCKPAVAARASACRPTTTTSIPRAASATAAARPIPEPPPVTNAVRAENSEAVDFVESVVMQATLGSDTSVKVKDGSTRIDADR